MKLEFDLIEINSLPFIKFNTGQGEHLALLDTGCDNTIVCTEEEVEDKKVTIVGLGGQQAACSGHVRFDIFKTENCSAEFNIDAVVVEKIAFDVFEKNGIDNVRMILGTNFLNKYKMKIDFKKKTLTMN